MIYPLPGWIWGIFHRSTSWETAAASGLLGGIVQYFLVAFVITKSLKCFGHAPKFGVVHRCGTRIGGVTLVVGLEALIHSKKFHKSSQVVAGEGRCKSLWGSN